MPPPQLPPIAVDEIPPRVLTSGSLPQHVSRLEHQHSPLHFGRHAYHRFDASDGGFGVLYLAADLATALMESVFHAHDWQHTDRRLISEAKLDRRLIRVTCPTIALTLADLCAPGAMASASA